MARRLAVLVLGALGSAALALDTLPRPNVGPPLILRLDGVLSASVEEAKRIGFTAASYAFLGTDDVAVSRWIGVTDARTIGGDNAVSGKDVLDSLAPYRPMFLVAGTPAITAQLRDASVGATVRVEGLVDRASRTYYLRSVRRDGEPDAMPPSKAD